MRALGRLTSRLVPHPALSVMLVIVWLLLLNAFSLGGLVLAVILGLLIPLATRRYWPDRPRIRYGRTMLVYLAIVLVDIVVSNLQVAAVVLFRPNKDLRPAWIVIPLELRSPEAITMLAGTITLTPGTISADLSTDGRALLVHCLDAPDPEAIIERIKRRYEARLAEIFA